MSDLGFQTTLNVPYDQALDKVTAALKVEGFGVLTNIDVRDTMKRKLDVDFRNYAILGVCNPSLAYKALTARLDAGLLLPCKVILYEDGSGTIVNIMDPLSMTQLIEDSTLQPIVDEARTRLTRVHTALQN